MLFGPTREEYNRIKNLLDFLEQTIKQQTIEMEKIKIDLQDLKQKYDSLRASFAVRQRYTKRDVIMEKLQDLISKGEIEKAKQIAELLGIELKLV